MLVLVFASVFTLYFMALVDKYPEYGCNLDVTHWQDKIGLQDSGGAQAVAPINKYLKNRTAGRNQKIPYFIYQTNQYDYVPLRMKYAMNSILEKNPEYTYRYFNGTQRRLFIKEYMGNMLLDIYDKVIPATYKGNIFRFALVYTYGGCYFDSGSNMANSLSAVIQPNMEFVGYRDGQYQNNSSRLSSSFFCSIPKSSILEQALNSLIRSVAIESYGINTIDITGTMKVSRAFQKFVPESIINNQLHGGYYRNKTIVVYQYSYPAQICLVGAMHQPDLVIFFSNKYPYYTQDMKWYTKKQYYGSYYQSRTVYDTSLIVTVPQDFNIRNNLRSDEDFRILPGFEQ